MDRMMRLAPDFRKPAPKRGGGIAGQYQRKRS